MATQLPLQIGQPNRDFVDVVSDAKSHEIRLLLWPVRWQQYQLVYSLNWQVFEFNEETIQQIPRDAGVYTFLVQPRIACNLDASYLMYVGKTDRSLRQRYREYLREMANPTGRPQIIDTLIRYSGFVYFSCASVSDQALTPTQVEDELLKAFMPPNNPTLPVEVRRIRKAFS